ncbi:alpha/beta fold hydrolase [Cryptosporangium aurantiacum]|uniref:Pimeloyl-ACP methyl ester carboxylesterase n=1 Tax=Cryptosporangium aurantiacum TaxID=134849 RepID=A0A1M7RGA1_9ACTN|nr:alpha/beta hydrolase [Cryptosporangium aurantiacum]SHN45313.1 Pimeloyl-ACP methyl ester carboxylesterase [Cryptosporangium aurantiacum]
MTTRTVEVNGIAQRYHVHGQGAAVLVAVPGGPGVSWDSLRMPEVERATTVVYVEPLGTGESGRLPTHPNGYTRAVYAAALDRVLDDVGEERVYLLGHSYGGFVAQYYAAHHPERLAGVVLYESAPVTGAEHQAEAARQVGEFARRNDGNPELPAVLEAIGSVGSITDDEQLTRTLRGLLPAYFAHYWEREQELAPYRDNTSVTYISGLDADGNPDTVQDRELLAGLTVPTLVIGGRYDVICGERWAREIHDLVPGSRLVILEESGHLGHVEEPERFAAAIAELVASTK